MKVLGTLLMFGSVCALAFGQTQAPEIDAGSAGSALALLSGALLVIRAVLKK